jgi:hypothetical protein
MDHRLPTTLISRGRCLAAGRDAHCQATVSTGHGVAIDETLARRLAACYRACHGIPIDRLEWACQGASDSHRLARLESELHRAALAGLDRQLEAVGVANTPGRQIP